MPEESDFSFTTTPSSWGTFDTCVPPTPTDTQPAATTSPRCRRSCTPSGSCYTRSAAALSTHPLMSCPNSAPLPEAQLPPTADMYLGIIPSGLLPFRLALTAGVGGLHLNRMISPMRTAMSIR